VGSTTIAIRRGRVVVETFYGRFDVLPGEVGLGYDSLVAPTILIMFGTALIGLLMIQLGRLTLAIGGGIVLLVIYIFITEDSLHSWRSVGFIVLALVALGVLGVVGMLEESYGRPVWIALISVITVTVATMAIATAAAAADDAEDGRPVSMTILGIPITAIRATPVHVTGLPDVPSCMLLLGSADDVLEPSRPHHRLAPPGGCHHDHDGLPERMTSGQDRLTRAPLSIR
jgi:hypothetical protein